MLFYTLKKLMQKRETINANKICILNGRLGDLTCYKGNGSSLVDYLMCKPCSMSIVKEFSNFTKVFSDHRAFRFSLTCNSAMQECQNTVLSDGVIKT